MEGGNVTKWGIFFFFVLFFLFFTFQNHWNFFWVYRNRNFLLGKSISRQEKNQEEWLCPLWKIFLIHPCVCCCQLAGKYMSDYKKTWLKLWGTCSFVKTLLVIPCLFMQYEKILMVWVRITRGWNPSVIRTQTINIVRIAWEQTGGNKFITQ